MAETKLNSLDYLSGVFRGLSTEKKDCVLNTARSLLKIQDDNNYPVNSKKEEFTSLETSSAYLAEECE